MSVSDATFKVKMRSVRKISREVAKATWLTPQRLYAEHPSWMMRQSELLGDQELEYQRLEAGT